MTSTGGSIKAKRLAVGDDVEVKGRTWTVTKASRAKSTATVMLTLTSGADSFTGVVPEGQRFARPALIEPANGAQQRWATDDEHRGATARLLGPDTVTHDDDATLELDPWVPSTDAEQAVSSIMGGTLIGVQRQGSDGWIVPPVDGSTVFAHLLTFHDTTPPSASLNDVRTPMAELLDTAAEALMRADIAGALLLHQQLHGDPHGPGTPHVHRAA